MSFKRIKIIFLIIIVLFTNFPIITKAEDSIKTTISGYEDVDVKNFEYSYTDVLKGYEILGSTSNNQVSLIALNSNQEWEKIEDSGLYKRNINTSILY